MTGRPTDPDRRSNGTEGQVDAVDAVGDVDDVEDEPLAEAEAMAGAAVGGEATGETLQARIAAVLADLGDVTTEQDGEPRVLAVAGHPFLVIAEDRLEVELDPAVARAALATPGTRPSARRAGWVAFSPEVPDRFALDRAEAWIRLAHRRAAGGRPG